METLFSFPELGNDSKFYLVKSDGDLLLVLLGGSSDNRHLEEGQPLVYRVDTESRSLHAVSNIGSRCGDPGLPIRNTRYAYNSRSHDQCVVNPHIRVDNRITSSITVPNNILTIGHMTKHDIATQGKPTTKQRIQSSVDDPRHAYYPTSN
jgi:hypothetical protein